jgi:precorrin-2 dehydrogenase/sirohydrochlorin ferrochelatase
VTASVRPGPAEAARSYPVNLIVEGRPCLLVGGGAVAARKAAGLVAAGAAVTVVAPEVHPDIEALPVTVERRPYRRGEVAGYRLAVTATGDAEVNQTVFDDGEAAGVWVNAADDPERCSFTLPAVVRRGPVVVTASTGGASPALASWLRERLDAQLAPELCELAAILAARRAELKAEGRATDEIDWAPIIEAELARLRAGAFPLRAVE